MADYTIAVLEDAIRVLSILEQHPGGLALTQITGASGFVKNKVFRILYTLEKHGFVERLDGRDYRLGLRLLELGHHVRSQSSLIEAGREVLDRLVKATGESIFMGILSGSEALCIDARESPQSIRLYAEIGRRVPLHSGGVPKVLLAFLPDEERQALLRQFEQDSGAPGVRVTASELEAVLAVVRRQGYAVVVDELDKGAHSVAAPIRDHTGCVVAGISIAGPSHRFTSEKIQHYIKLVLEASAEISHALGHAPAAPSLATSLTDGHMS